MKRAAWISALSGLAVASVAFGAPRESFEFTSVESNGTQGSPANALRDFSAVGGYTAGKITHAGELTSVHPETYASEARILVTPPGGRPTFILQPFTTAATWVGTIIYAMDTALVPAYNPAGNWNLRFFESFDDGGTAAVDAVWDRISFTLDDEVPPPPPPPPHTDLGSISRNSSSSHNFSLSAGQVFWYRFEVDFESSVAANRYFDIDTEGSSISGGTFPNDTYLGLYFASGDRRAIDDDDGSDFLSQLTFGAGQRPPVGNGQPYNGRDGALAPGVYYLGCSAFPTTFGATGFSVSTTHTHGGFYQVNLRNGLGVCRADYNGDGQVDFFDYLDFVQDFAAGCDD